MNVPIFRKQSLTELKSNFRCATNCDDVFFFILISAAEPGCSWLRLHSDMCMNVVCKSKCVFSVRKQTYFIQPNLFCIPHNSHARRSYDILYSWYSRFRYAIILYVRNDMTCIGRIFIAFGRDSIKIPFVYMPAPLLCFALLTFLKYIRNSLHSIFFFFILSIRIAFDWWIPHIFVDLPFVPNNKLKQHLLNAGSNPHWQLTMEDFHITKGFIYTYQCVNIFQRVRQSC